MSIIDDTLNRLNKERTGSSMGLGLGQALMSAPVSRPKDSWEDVLLASAIKGIGGGLVSGFAQNQLTAQAEEDALYSSAIDRMTPEEFAVEAEDPQSAQIFAAHQQEQNKQARTAQLLADKFANAKRLENIKHGNRESLAEFNAKNNPNAYPSVPDIDRRELNDLKSVIDTTGSHIDYFKKFPTEDIKSIEGMSNRLTREIKGLTGDQAANEVTSRLGQLKGELQQLIKGIRSDRDSKLIQEWSEGGAAVSLWPNIINNVERIRERAILKNEVGVDSVTTQAPPQRYSAPASSSRIGKIKNILNR